MIYFKEWLLVEEQQNYQSIKTIEQAKQLATTAGGLDFDTQGIERIKANLNAGGEVYFTDHFPIKDLGRNRQGWAKDKVLEMFGTFAKSIGQVPPKTIEDAQNMPIDYSTFNRMISPVIISMMPDESYHISDGNHRLGCAIVLKFPTIKAFVVK